MSRTDVHAPWWVKTRDPAWRVDFRERHDHSDGVCNLDEWLATDGTGWHAGTCYVANISRRRNIGCGCRMCTGHVDRRRARRAERHQWATLRHHLLTSHREHHDDILTHTRRWGLEPPGARRVQG